MAILAATRTSPRTLEEIRQSLQRMRYSFAGHVHDAADITTGLLAVARGGTAIGAYAVGDLLYASGATTLARLADVAAGSVLLAGGVGAAPTWGAVGLTTHVTGILPVANGGTGVATLTLNRLLRGNGTSPIADGTLSDDGAGFLTSTFGTAVTLRVSDAVAGVGSSLTLWAATGGTGAGGGSIVLITGNANGGGTDGVVDCKINGAASGSATLLAVGTQLTALNASNISSGILATANGGTGIAFFTAAGPTAARVYTFPDAACTILSVASSTGTRPQFGGLGLGMAADATIPLCVVLGTGSAGIQSLRKTQATPNDTGGYTAWAGGDAGTTQRGAIGFGHRGAGADTLLVGETADAFCIRAEGVLQLGTNAGTLAVTIDTAQNVGIGMAPTYKLDVNGQACVVGGAALGANSRLVGAAVDTGLRFTYGGETYAIEVHLPIDAGQYYYYDGAIHIVQVTT